MAACPESNWLGANFANFQKEGCFRFRYRWEKTEVLWEDGVGDLRAGLAGDLGSVGRRLHGPAEGALLHPRARLRDRGGYQDDRKSPGGRERRPGVRVRQGRGDPL